MLLRNFAELVLQERNCSNSGVWTFLIGVGRQGWKMSMTSQHGRSIYLPVDLWTSLSVSIYSLHEIFVSVSVYPRFLCLYFLLSSFGLISHLSLWWPLCLSIGPSVRFFVCLSGPVLCFYHLMPRHISRNVFQEATALKQASYQPLVKQVRQLRYSRYLLLLYYYLLLLLLLVHPLPNTSTSLAVMVYTFARLSLK